MTTNHDPASGSDDKFLDNHDKLKASLSNPQIAALIPPADQAAITADNTDMHQKKSASDIQDAAAQQATKDKNTSFATGRTDYRAIRQRFMKATGYTPALGELAGVERTETAPASYADAGPTAELHGKPGVTGGAELKGKKNGADAMDIYGKRDGDTDFVFLMRVLRFPWTDKRPLLVSGKPETRQFYGQLVIKGQPAGQRSPIITVIVSA